MDHTNEVEGLLQPVGKARLHDAISAQINRLIAEGKLSPGDRLPPERELAERFKVSRNSVRDALRTLEARGLIETRQGDGTYVRQVRASQLSTSLADALVSSKQSIGEMLQARQVIEPGIAFYAALNARPEQLAELEQLVERHEDKAQQGDPGVQEDALFHYTLAQMTGNAFLVSMMDFINGRIEASRDMLLRYDESSTRRGHRAILAALRARDPGAAQQAMAAHIGEVMAAYELLG